ncbi:MAG: hypothetical protein V1875_08110 [Candidatus Altiarchaeota archaeon]
MAKNGKEKQRHALLTAGLCIALVLLVAALFSPHLSLGFGDFDNGQWYGEAKARNTLWKALDYTQNTGYTPSTYYQPVQTLVWAAMVKAVDNEPYWYYALGMAIHASSAIVLFLLMHELTGKFLPSFGAAASFAVFFPNYQTFSWISAAITHGLTGLFFATTLLMYVRHSKTGSRTYYALSVAAFAVGVLTKEITVFAVPIIFAYYVLLERRGGLRPVSSDLKVVPFAALVLPFVYISRVILSRSVVMSEWGGVNFGVHMLYRFMDYLSYLASVVPISLGLRLVFAYAALLILPILAYYASRDRMLAYMGVWLALSISMFVYTNFRDVYSIGRYLYVPSMAWFGLLFYGVSRIRDSILRSWSYAALISYGFVLNAALILFG